PLRRQNEPLKIHPPRTRVGLWGLAAAAIFDLRLLDGRGRRDRRSGSPHDDYPAEHRRSLALVRVPSSPTRPLTRKACRKAMSTSSRSRSRLRFLPAAASSFSTSASIRYSRLR